VANADFEGGDNDNGYGDYIFLGKHGQPSHTLHIHTYVYNRAHRPRLEKTLFYINGRHSSWTPGVFYKYFYNHAHRLRLEKLF
jgi:hypothetical protein